MHEAVLKTKNTSSRKNFVQTVRVGERVGLTKWVGGTTSYKYGEITSLTRVISPVAHL